MNMVELKEMLAPKHSAARTGYTLLPKYITIHNTANTGKGAGAVSHGKYLSGAGAKKAVSYHYAVDDGCIVRIIPDSENAWHAGDGANGRGNRQSLAIEICENPESDLRRATDNAAELTARLMHDWNIPLANVVQHNHWSGKDCPRRLRRGEPYSWDTFLAKVQAFYEGGGSDAPADNSTLYTVQTGAFRDRAKAESYAAQLKRKGIEVFVTRRGELYTVQTGAFQTKKNAEAYAVKLKAKGVDTYVTQKGNV